MSVEISPATVKLCRGDILDAASAAIEGGFLIVRGGRVRPHGQPQDRIYGASAIESVVHASGGVSDD